jgi:hypothetical protein
MPTYSYRNKQTGEVTTEFMSMSEHEHYLDDKPHLEQILISCNIVDAINIGVTKPPADFQKYVLGRIKNSVPQAESIADRRWDIPKEI